MSRIGMISFAHMHAYSYAEALRALPGAELAGVWDEDQERGREAAARFDTVFQPDLAAFLAADLDGVIVTSANTDHRRLTLAAAAARKHVLCEKPLATTAEDARAMIDACRAAGVRLMTAFPCRFHPAAARLREAITRGDLGRIQAIKATNHGMMPGGWFLERDKAGGGAVMDHTVHVADLLRWFLGQEIKQVYAEAGTLLHDVAIDDCGLLSLAIGDGIFATLDTSWSRPPAFPTWGDVTMEIVGTKGAAQLDLFAQNIILYGAGERTAVYENWGTDADYRLVENFVRVVSGQEEPLVTGEDGLKALEVALAAYQSRERREVVAI